MFDDPSFENARIAARNAADYMRLHGPFEPHRLPLDEMEYTTMPEVKRKLEKRFQDL
jgi:fructose 1,6-bisphosphate aldolase/phosphatase